MSIRNLAETKELSNELTNTIDISEQNSAAPNIDPEKEFALQREKLMNLLEDCDETIDYKEMDDQLETMRKSK